METLRHNTMTSGRERDMRTPDRLRAEVEIMRLAAEARAEEAALAAHRLYEFLAGMSDELRTPLNNLLILAKVLADNEGENLNAQQVDYAQTIYAAGTDLLSLVDDILDLAALESAGIAPDISTQGFRELRIYLLRTFRPLARDKRIGFDVVLSQDLPSAMETDGKRLRQVLKSMLSLAFKPARGGRIDVSVARAGPMVAFDIVHRADGSIGCEHATRLGLSICRELARSLGGAIHVAAAGEVHFRLELPVVGKATRRANPVTVAGDAIARAEAAAAHTADRQRAASRDTAITLIAEGNPQVAAVLLDMVRTHGHEGLVAPDLASVRILLERFSPEAVLVGGSLGDVDGWTALGRILQDGRRRRIPFILHCRDGTRWLSLSLGPPLDGVAGDPAEVLRALDRISARRLDRLLVAGLPAAALGRWRGGGREIEHAATGLEGLEALQTGHFDALVAPWTLADMDALQMLRALAAELRVSDFPIALVEPAGTAEIALLRQRDRLDELLGDVAAVLGRGESAQRPATAPERWAELAGRHALLVDEDVYSLYAIASALERHGMTVVPADDWRQGAATLAAQPEIDVVLVDFSWLDSNWEKGIEAMRAAAQRPTLPVIALSARAAPTDRDRWMASGASDYLCKPVNVEQMLALVRAWIVRSR